jgi:hypothetical protein
VGLVGLTGKAGLAHDAWQAAARTWARRARDLVSEMIGETLRSGAAGGADQASSVRATMAEMGRLDEASELAAGAAELGSSSQSESSSADRDRGSSSGPSSSSEPGRRAQDPSVQVARAEDPRAKPPTHGPPFGAKLEPMELQPMEAQLEAQLEALGSWARSDATTPTTPDGWATALDLVASLPEARRAQGFLMPGYAARPRPCPPPPPPPRPASV